MRDIEVVEKIECVGAYYVACSLRSVDGNFEWAFASVYGPNDNNDRRVFWDELAGLLTWLNFSSCIGGDFNIIRYPSEGSSDTRSSPAMIEFSEFIFELGLTDILLLVVISRDLIIVILRCGLELTGYFSLLTGKHSFLTFLRGGSLVFYWITFPYCLIVVMLVQKVFQV